MAQQSVDLGRIVGVLGWMALPVIGGFCIWQWGLKRRDGGAAIAAATTRTLSRTVLLCASPVLMVVLFWPAEIPLGAAATLPAVGLFAHLVGGAVGWGIARAAGLGRSARGAFFLCGLSSNILSFGGIATLFLVGPYNPGGPTAALADLALYRVFETPIYFLFAWPVFAMFAPTDDDRPVRWWSTFRKGFRPVTLAPIAGMVVGCILNAAAAPMPGWLAGLAAPLVKLNTLMIGVIVGLTLRFASPGKYLGTCLTFAGVKFAIIPVATVSLAWLLGFRSHTLAVVMVCSSMPLANFAVIGAAYYRLEEDRIAAVWIFTMALMLLVVPILAVLVGLMA